MTYCLKKQSNKKAFTLIELLIVIAIIGILSGVVMVSSRSGVDKAKRASAISTASSAMVELVTCGEDGGLVKTDTFSATGGGTICCTSASGACTTIAGHALTWPDLTNIGWRYRTNPTGNLNVATGFVYVIENIADNTQIVTCRTLDGSCT